MGIQLGTLVRRVLSPPRSEDRGTRGIPVALVFIVVTWVPVALLSLGHWLAHGEWPTVALRFETHVRLLLAAPLVFGASRVIYERALACARQLVEGGYVKDRELERYDEIVASWKRLRESRIALAVLLAIVVATLRWSPHDSSAAGLWDNYVALTAVRFLLARELWYWLAWARFLAQTSELDLSLVATHPDLAGGLGFVCQPSEAFGLIVLAVSMVLAAQLASQVALTGARVVFFQNQLVVFAIFMALLAIVPLVPFSVALIRLKEQAVRDYGGFQRRFGAAFRENWIPKRPEWPSGTKPSALAATASGAPLDLKSPEMGGLAALTVSFNSIAGMRPFPFEPRLVVTLALAAFLPAVPVFLMQLPLEVVISPILKVL